MIFARSALFGMGGGVISRRLSFFVGGSCHRGETACRLFVFQRPRILIGGFLHRREEQKPGLHLLAAALPRRRFLPAESERYLGTNLKTCVPYCGGDFTTGGQDENFNVTIRGGDQSTMPSKDLSPYMKRKPNTQSRVPLMHLPGQPALKARLAASSKRDGNEWARFCCIEMSNLRRPCLSPARAAIFMNELCLSQRRGRR